MSKVVDPETFIRRMLGMKTVKFGPSEAGAVFTPDATMRFECSPQVLYHKNFSLISESFTRFLSEGYRILILSDSVHCQTDRLRSIFEDRGDKIEFTPVEYTIHEGFVDHATKTCFFTDHQIFDRFHNYNLPLRQGARRETGAFAQELNQIETGDYIVHIDHGIGRFGGLVRTSVNGTPQEMIKLYYQNNDLVLVSIHALHKLSKYRGKEGIPPKISKLGGGAWTRMKEKTKGKMKDIARDLIRLLRPHANRKKASPFSPTFLSAARARGVAFIYEDTLTSSRRPRPCEGRHGIAAPDGQTYLRRRGIRQDRDSRTRRLQGSGRRKTDRRACPVTTVLALQHYHTPSPSASRICRCAWIFPRQKAQRGEADTRRSRGRQNRYTCRHTQAYRQNSEIQRPRTAHCG